MATFVLLHGIPGSAATWDAVCAALEAGGHRVVVPELLGFGPAPVPDDADALLAPNQARHVLAVMDAAGVADAVVAGHDFGGPVAAHLVATAPERVSAVALFATNAFPDTPIPFPLSTITWPVVGALAERALFSRPSLVAMVRRGGRGLDVHRYVGDARQRAAIAGIFGASLRRLRELYTPVEAALRSTTVPALVGWGDRDPFFPLDIGRRTADLFGDGRLRVYEGAGHFLPEERPAELTADLLALAALVAAP